MQQVPDTIFETLPIEGEIQYGGAEVEQKPIEELAAALQRVLNIPEIEAVTWTQYTPYFNDGDPCVFSAYMLHLRLAQVPLDEEGNPRTETNWDDPRIIEAYDPVYREMIGWHEFDRNTRTWRDVPGNHVIAALYVPELAAEINSGAHNVELLRLFGDNAQVTATAEKFTVEFWEHD